VIIRVERAFAKTLIKAAKELGHVPDLFEDFRRGSQ
jgi:hypothetical protein